MAIPRFRIRFVLSVVVNIKVTGILDLLNVIGAQKNLRLTCLKEIDDIFSGGSKRAKVSDQY